MADTQGRERDFVLAPNELIFIQDMTKGQISVYVGPHKSTLASTDSPIIYDNSQRKFIQVDLQRAIQQFPAADEGFYIVLENPADDDKRPHPELATVNSLAKLQLGRKINIPGPQTFPLWPGQVAKVVKGHSLRTNQYLLVRVYNDEEAKKNKGIVRGVDTEQASEMLKSEELTMGKLLVIKGKDVSFYIPPTGIEVVPEDNGSYVREAVTLERLEYCVLLSETGDKRYVIGPDVVFPAPTETFIEMSRGVRKYKAIELNDDMGIHIKVTADYEEDEKVYKAGDELFITGKEIRLYYPRAEHSIIRYDDKEIHYGVAIPEGEARYVLNKASGKVELIDGPQIFLADPRNQVIVRRTLTDSEVSLWFPGNDKALEYNAYLRNLSESINGALPDRTVRKLSKSVDFGTASASAFVGEEFNRKTQYTPPRTITLDTKYDGAVAISVWNGYAILVVDKAGNQRVEVGPKTVHLKYDESLQVLHLSTGKPKTTDRLEKTVYLRVSYNQVSDTINIVTKDMVTAQIKLSYRVNFEDEASKWFSVENYVKFMTDHARSLLRNAAKKYTIEQLNANYIDIVRDTILGTSGETKRKGRVFVENGMVIYDVEVSHLAIGDATVARMLEDMQKAAVQQTLNVATRERELSVTERLEVINREIASKVDETAKHHHDLEKERLSRDKVILEERLKITQENERRNDLVLQAALNREKLTTEQRMEAETSRQELTINMLKAEVDAFAKKFEAISPDFIAVLHAFIDTNLATQLATSIAPLALAESQGLQFVWDRTFKGTPVEGLLKKALSAKGDN